MKWTKYRRQKLLIGKFKTWQKILLLVCATGLLGSLLLFHPQAQSLILDLGERLVGRALNRPIWYSRIARFRIRLCMTFVFFGFLLLPVRFGKTQFFSNARKSISSFAKKPLLAFPILYIILLAIGFSLMCLVYSIPVKMMQDNLADSVSYFRISEQISNNQRIMEKSDGHLDDFTDALMLIEAAHKSERSVPVAAMLNERPSVKDKNPFETLVSIWGDGNNEFNIVPYGRYWHGYEIFLKPLLYLATYGGIRRAMMLLQISLVIVFVLILARKNRIAQIIPFLGMWIFLNPPTIMISLQYNSMFVITMVELILIASFDKSYYDIHRSKLFCLYHFFVAGCLTSYFDFLTYPLLTFGVPIIFLISLNEQNFRDNFVLLVKCAIFWSLGYVLMWAGKWILGSIVTGTNLLKQANDAIKFRTSSSVEGKEFSYFQVVLSNLRSGIFVPMILAAFAIFICNTKRGMLIQKKDLIFLVCALMPFAWYAIAQNHSFIHSWFTYRILGITVFAILTLCVSMKREE